MNLEKPSLKSAGSTALQMCGVAGGAALSRGVFGAIPLTAPATGFDWKRVGARVVLVAIGIAAASAVNGVDTGAKVSRGAAVGFAGMQFLEGIADFSKSNTKTATLATSTKATDKFMARTLGLACPCDEVHALNRPRRRPMNAAIDTSDYAETNAYAPAKNALELAVQAGASTLI